MKKSLLWIVKSVARNLELKKPEIFGRVDWKERKLAAHIAEKLLTLL